MPQITELWAEVKAKQAWYAGGAAYWASTEPTNDGVLGGYGRVHAADMKDSRAFVTPLLVVKPKRALDVAAGIGRVSDGLLLDLCDRVDLLEECERFMQQARSQLAPAGDRVRFFCSRMQDFVPEAGGYDLIWVQWCIGSLSDADLVAFLTRCKAGLATGGLIVLKDNILDHSCPDKLERGPGAALYLVDREDNTVIRSREYLDVLLQRCDLRHVCTSRTAELGAAELYPVGLYALR
mmetsp:Transcript_19310/g.62984  ORF Transcript_19310/g.62984 Transcript_19310/m.62984 type:complete len:237 (+) Transcript_19310:113-823(+)